MKVMEEVVAPLRSGLWVSESQNNLPFDPRLSKKLTTKSLGCPFWVWLVRLRRFGLARGLSMFSCDLLKDQNGFDSVTKLQIQRTASFVPNLNGV